MTESKELTLPQKVAVMFQSAEHERKAAELVASSARIVAITNPAGYQECHASRMVLKNTRIALEKLGKEIRDEANRTRDAILTEEKRLIGMVSPEEKRLQAIQDAYDAEQQRIKDTEAAKEAERIACIREAIESITNTPLRCVGATVEMIREGISDLENEKIDASRYAELLPFALAARVDALEKLRPMLAERLALDAEAERQRLAKIEAEKAAKIEAEKVAAERAELAKLRAENERLAKMEQERQAEAARREREQMDRERAQQEAAAKAERNRIAAEAEVARKAHEAREAEAKKVRDAEDARIAAERKKLDDERKAAELAAQRERTAAQNAEREIVVHFVMDKWSLAEAAALSKLQELFS